MSEIKTLLRLELRSFYGINKIIHTKDLKVKSRSRALCLVWIILIGMLFVYIGALTFGLCTLGLSSIVPAYLTVISSAFILFFGFFSAGNRIFGQRGYDILVSMPLKSSSIVISRFLGLYIADLAVAFAIMLPGIAVYGYCMRPSFLFYLFAMVSTLFIPTVPLVLSVLFGTFVLSITSRMKRKSTMQSLFAVLLVLGIMVASFNFEGFMQNTTTEQFINIAQSLGNAINSVYPIAMWVNFALINSSVLYLLLVVLFSVAAMTITFFIATKCFNFIVRRLLNFTAKHNYKIGALESRTVLKALYLRELKRYFSSSIYVTNTIIGPILGCIMAVALCVSGLDSLKTAFPFEFDIVSVLPFVFSAVFCIMPTSAVSISMEGKQFDIVKSLPIPSKALLDSKILLNLSLLLPFYIISVISFIISANFTVVQLIWLILIPIFVILFTVTFGITVNLKFHSFDWEQEVTVVKQSLPSFLGGFVGVIVSLIFGVIVFSLPEKYSDIVKLALCMVILLCTALLYRFNNKKQLETL